MRLYSELKNDISKGLRQLSKLSDDEFESDFQAMAKELKERFGDDWPVVEKTFRESRKHYQQERN